MAKRIKKKSRTISHSGKQIEYYEDKSGFGLHFKQPIDPQILIDAIKAIQK